MAGFSESATTYTYDGTGGMTAAVDGQSPLQVTIFDHAGRPIRAELRSVAASPISSDPNGPIKGLFTHTFEFRLSGSEEVTQSIPLPYGSASDCLMAATKAVRMSVTRNPDATTASIAGVEVHTEVRGKQVVCVARVTDFTADDLVVVQADVIVYSEQVLP